MIELRDIIEGCKKGKRKAQDALYNKYSGLLYGVCLRYTNEAADAQDVMQEGFVKIYKNIGTFSLENSFEGWMRRITVLQEHI